MEARPTAQLGAELRTAREKRERSLRSIASEAEISTAYLQKLERGEVASPSPKILRRLATTLEIDYERLMHSAGFAPLAGVQPRPVGLEAKLATAKLTEVEERAVAAFVDILVAGRSLDDSRDEHGD